MSGPATGAATVALRAPCRIARSPLPGSFRPSYTPPCYRKSLQ